MDLRQSGACALALLLLLTTGIEQSRADEAFPTRPVTLVVPFPAGSATDAVARRLAEELRKSLGQNFLVENKAGADGIIAARAVAGAPPDGYTLLITSNTTHSANPNIYARLPYDAEKDFAPISGVAKIPFLLAVRPDFPAMDLKGFVSVAKTRQPALLYGTSNTGTLAAGEMLKVRLGIDMQQVPYRGSAQAITDLIAGRIDVYFPGPASGRGMIEEGRFKILATTGGERVPSLPNVPTMEELGVPDYRIVAWVAAYAPAGTPTPIVTLLSRTIRTILIQPEMVEFGSSIGSDLFPTSPDELAAFVREDTRRWAEIVRTARLERK